MSLDKLTLSYCPTLAPCEAKAVYTHFVSPQLCTLLYHFNRKQPVQCASHFTVNRCSGDIISEQGRGLFHTSISTQVLLRTVWVVLMAGYWNGPEIL